VDIAVSEAAELIVGLGMVTGTDENFDVGSDWFHEARTKTSSDLGRQVALLQGSGTGRGVWHMLLAAIADAPLGLPAFIEHLEAMPADELWLQMLGYHDQIDPSPELRDAMVAAGRGQVEPLEHWFEREPSRTHWIHGLARGLGADAEVARRVVLDLLVHWQREVFAPQWPAIAPILERDAEEKRRLAGQRTAGEVVEEATNGGEYVPEAGIGRLLLIPTYLGRPWVNLNRQRDTLVIVHPVGDAALAGSPDEARRRQVLRLAKALSDDTRLHALRLMAGSSRSLQELADELGIRKSTMHHHLAVLRAAGLLRLRFFEKRYSLRTAPLSEMSGLLGEYLGNGRKRS
jgi:DNA-binding transcriptional ArsR family regulator